MIWYDIPNSTTQYRIIIRNEKDIAIVYKSYSSYKIKNISIYICVTYKGNNSLGMYNNIKQDPRCTEI